MDLTIVFGVHHMIIPKLQVNIIGKERIYIKWKNLKIGFISQYSHYYVMC